MKGFVDTLDEVNILVANKRAYQHHRLFSNLPWILQQTWENVLFIHYPIHPKALQKYVPGCLTLDSFNGMCWVGIVLFSVNKNRVRIFPAITGTDQFIQMNVRTYVTVNGKPGVYFLSIDTSNRFAAKLAKMVYLLPNYHADMTLQPDGCFVDFHSIRTQNKHSQLQCRYRAISKPFHVRTGTLDEWLIERYCLYNLNRKGQLVRCDLSHAPWQLHQAEATILKNTMLSNQFISVESIDPIFHFSKKQDARLCPLVLV